MELSCWQNIYSKGKCYFCLSKSSSKFGRDESTQSKALIGPLYFLFFIQVELLIDPMGVPGWVTRFLTAGTSEKFGDPVRELYDRQLEINFKKDLPPTTP